MQHSDSNDGMRRDGLKKLEQLRQDKSNSGTQPAEKRNGVKQGSVDTAKGAGQGPENVDPQAAANRRPVSQHSRFRPGAAKPDLPRSQASLPAPAAHVQKLEASSAAADPADDAPDRLEAYHDALEAMATSSAAGDGAVQLEEEVKSLKRQLADARAGEEKRVAELQVAHSQTDSAVAQLRGMHERLDALEADLAREREDKAAMKESSAKAVAAAKQHAADMSRDLEAVHDEFEDQQRLKQEADKPHRLAAELSDELASAQERMQQMQAELKGVKHTAREQLLELKQLKVTVAEMSSQRAHPDKDDQAQQSDATKELKKAERLSKRMELRLKEAEEKVSDLNARANIAKQRIAILERELETSGDVQKELQSELSAARAQAAADRQQLQSKVDKLNDALRLSQKQAKQADSEAQEMEKAFRVLQTEMAQMGCKVASDTKAANGAQASAEAQAAAAADRAKLEHRLAQLTEELEAQQQSTQAERRALEEEMARVKSEANTLRSQIGEASGAMQARDKEISSMKAQLRDTERQGESRMAKVRAELSAVRSEAAARMRDLECQLTEARASPPWRRAGTLAEAASLDANRAALTAAEAEISGLHTALQEAQQALSDASATLNDVQAQRDAAVSARLASEQALAALQQQHEAVASGRLASEHALAALQQRCDAAEAASAAQEQAMASLQAGLEAAENARMAGLQAGEEEVKQLLAAVTDVEGDKEEAEKEASHLRQLYSAAREAQTAAEAEANRLGQQLERAQHDLEDASGLSKEQCDRTARQLADVAAAKAEADAAGTKAVELQGSLESLHQELKIACCQLQSLEAQLAAASERDADQSAKLAAAQALEASLRSSLQSASAAGAMHEIEAQALRGELAASEQKVHMLTADLELAKQVQADADVEVAELRVKLVAAQQDMEAQKAGHAEESEQLQGQLATLQGTVAAAEDAAAAAEAAREEAEARSTALEQSLQQAAEAAKKHSLRMAELQKRLQRAEAELAALSSSAQEVEAAAFDSRRKLEEQVHELAAKQQALQADMQGRVDQLGHVAAEAQAAAQEQLADLIQEVSGAQAAVAQAHEDLSAAQAAREAERQEDHRQLSEVRAALQCAEAESARLLTQRAELEASLDAAQQDKDVAMTAAPQQAACTADDIARLEGTLSEVQERLAKAEALLSASTEAQAQLQADRDELASALAQSADALQRSDSTIRELQDAPEAFATAHKHCGELEAALQASNDTQAQLQADRDELAASLTETADALQSSERALCELRDSNSALLTVHERCAASEASLRASTEVHAQLVADRDELAASLEETAAALQRSEAARSNLQISHDSLATSAQEHEQQITQLTAQVDDLQRELELTISREEATKQLTAQSLFEARQSQDRLAMLLKLVASQEQALAEKGTQLTSAAELHASETAKLSGRVMELQQHIERIEGTYQHAQERITSLEAQVATSTEQLSTAEEALSSTSEAAQSQHAEAEAVRSELAESKQALEAADSEVECLREMVTSWEEAFGKAQLELEGLKASQGEESDAEGLRVKLRAAVKKGKAIEKQRADLEAQLSSVREQVEAAQHDHARQVAGVKTELSDVGAMLAALEAQHAAAQQASSERDTRQASAIAALQEQLHDASEKLTHAESAASSSHQALADVSVALAAARSESIALRLEAEGLRSAVREQEDELQQQAAHADNWESECLGAQIRADAAEKKLQESAAQVLAAKELVAELEEQLTNTQSNYSHALGAQQELEQAQEQLQLLQQSHQDLSDKFQTASSKSAQLQNEVRSQCVRISELEANLEREMGAASAARESQEQLRSANMQLGLQLERLEQKLGAEQAARGEAEALYEELLASMAEAEDRAEVAEQSMARLQQLQEHRHANSAVTGGRTEAESGHRPDRQTPAEESADKAEASRGIEGLRDAVAADVSVAVGLLAKAERCATDVLARLGQSHSMARLLEGQAASVAAQLPQMQEVVSCAMRLDCQVAALSEGVVKRQIEFDEKAQSLSAMAAAQVEAMKIEQQGLKKELESAEEDKEALQQRLLDRNIPAPSPVPSAPLLGTPAVTPLPAGQGLLQRTAGTQVSASRLSREGGDADVELGFLDEEASPSMLDAFTPHSSRLSSELRPLASMPLLQHAPAPAISVAAHVDRLTSASMRWLQGHPLSRLGIVAYLFIMHVLLVLCSFSGRHGPLP